MVVNVCNLSILEGKENPKFKPSQCNLVTQKDPVSEFTKKRGGCRFSSMLWPWVQFQYIHKKLF